MGHACPGSLSAGLHRGAAYIDDCNSLDLDQPLGVNKARDLHDFIDWANLAKKFSMHCRDSLPILDPREQYPGAHDLMA